MNKPYQQPIILFGAVIPIMFLVIALLVLLVAKNSLVGDFEERKMAYTSEQQVNQQVTALKQQLESKKADLNNWTKLTSGDVYQDIHSNLLASVNDSSTGTLNITSESRSRDSRGIDTIVKNGVIGYDCSLTGTFLDMQTAALELETKMPNLFLSSLTIDPRAGKFCNFNLTYLAWTEESTQ